MLEDFRKQIDDIERSAKAVITATNLTEETMTAHFDGLEALADQAFKEAASVFVQHMEQAHEAVKKSIAQTRADMQTFFAANVKAQGAIIGEKKAA